ncbi:MAG: hypothetical protein A4S09_09835 [Proteobacteria bacterium SG_bin7]|nr:MAG: hypothetical protein A4S09_09835 [Proteobacteria bacterium SG_bin7]
MKLFLYFIIMCTLFLPPTALTATYYVATNGSDSNSGSSSSPWKNPQKCALPPIKAGDTCAVRAGTYTDVDGNGVTIYISSSSPAGTSAAPITIKSEIPLAATILVPSIINSGGKGSNTAIVVGRPYYRIEGFNITGGTKDLGSTTSYSGISFYPGGTGSMARFNSIHHVGRAVCSNTSYGMSGIFTKDVSNVIIEQNRIYSIGRRLNGESGCVTDKYQHDHGIYISGATNLVVRRNVFYDTTRGWPIQLYGGVINNINIYHNTIDGRNPRTSMPGQILLASVINGGVIKNNISSNAQGGLVGFSPYSTVLKPTSVVVSYNISSNSDRVGNRVGVTFSNNILNVANLGFVNKTASDYRITSTSSARNRGTKVGVPTVTDGLPDIGYFEFK